MSIVNDKWYYKYVLHFSGSRNEVNFQSSSSEYSSTNTYATLTHDTYVTSTGLVTKM